MRIFYDVDTQNDFMNKNGALYVRDAELIKPNLALLTKFAKIKAIPTLGSVDKHFGTKAYREREGELQKWGGPFPNHCMKETGGQLKIHETSYLEHPHGDMVDTAVYIPHYLKQRHKKISEEMANRFRFTGCFETPRVYFEKQSYDIFTNPAFSAFLDSAGINEAVVYGVATDYCVKAAVIGMQKRGIQCYVVKDAIKGVSKETTNSALEEMLKSGAEFISTKDVLGGMK